MALHTYIKVLATLAAQQLERYINVRADHQQLDNSALTSP
jgi:hypothetical protein